MSDIEVAITLRLRDQAASQAGKVLAEIRRSVGGVTAGNREAARSAAEVERAVQKEARSYDKVGKSLDAVVRHVGMLNRAARKAAMEPTQGAEKMSAAWRKVEGTAKSAAGAMRAAGRGVAASQAGKALAEIRRSVGNVTAGNREAARSAAEVERVVQKEARSYDKVGKSLDAVVRHVGMLNRAARKATMESTQGADKMAAAWRKVEGAAKSAAGAMRAAGRGISAAGQFGAGMAAGGYVVKQSLDKPIDFERLLADMSNTAFSDRDLEGRKAGMAELREVINKAVASGGGSRDSAAEALNAIIASRAVDIESAMAMLPQLQKFGTATGASPLELANIAIRGVQNEYFDPSQVGEALDKALVAGQEGSFELKDMARWLPQLMATARGMKGMEGFETILAAAQASVTTSGSADEAGNNLVNLLAKLSSGDSSNAFEKLDIDLSGTLAAAVQKGMTPLDAFVALVDKEVVGKDKKYQALQKELAAAQGDAEKSAVMGNMADVLEGGAIGEIMSDRQALMALVAVMNQRDYMAGIKDKFTTAVGAADKNFQVVSDTTSYKEEQAALAKEKAQDGLHEALKGPLDAALEKVAAFSETFPGLTTAAYAACTAIAAMTAAATAFAAIGMLRGGLGAALGGAGAAAAGGGAIAGGGAAAAAGGGALAGGGAAVAGGGGAVAGGGVAAATGGGAGAAVGGVSGVLAPLAFVAGMSYLVWTESEDMDRRGARSWGRGAGLAPRQGDGPAVAAGRWRGRETETVVDPAVTELVAEAQRILSEAQTRVSITNQLVLDGVVIARKVNEINARDMARR